MMKLRSYLKKVGREESGFTLIELMVVVVILGILGSIVVPRIANDVTGDAQDAADAANLKMIQAALNRYEVDTKTPVTGDMTSDELEAQLTGKKVNTTEYKAITGWQGPYLDEVPDGIKVDDGVVVD